MKSLFPLIAASILVATSASANIGDIDASIEEIKASAVVIAQPQSATNRILASGDSCVLPLTHLVAVPDSFDAAGAIVVACATE